MLPINNEPLILAAYSSQDTDGFGGVFPGSIAHWIRGFPSYCQHCGRRGPTPEILPDPICRCYCCGVCLGVSNRRN